MDKKVRRTLEMGFATGIRPITKEVIEQVLKPMGSQLELKYASSGYKASTLAKIIHSSKKEICQWFLGKLPELRVAEIHEALAHANVVV